MICHVAFLAQTSALLSSEVTSIVSTLGSCSRIKFLPVIKPSKEYPEHIWGLIRFTLLMEKTLAMIAMFCFPLSDGLTL